MTVPLASSRPAVCPVKSAQIEFLPAIGRWEISGYRNAEHVLHSARFVADNRIAVMLDRLETGGRHFPALRRLVPAITFFLDPPEHGPARQLLARLIGYQPLSNLQSRFAELVATILAGLSGRPTFDLVQDFARPLAHRFIGLILGLEAPETQTLAEGSERLIELLELVLPLRRFRELDACAESMLMTIGMMISDRRSAPRADSISAILPFAFATGVSDDRLAAFCVFLFIAGVETTLSTISGVASRLFADASGVDAVRADRSILPNMVETLLRLHSAVHKVARISLDNAVISTAQVTAGAGVTILLAEANRDRTEYPPSDIPIMEQMVGPPHLAFGGRAHYCLGAQHARALTISALDALLDLPGLHIAVDQEEWTDRGTVRSLARLPAIWNRDRA